jgi:hypothetical protein
VVWLSDKYPEEKSEGIKWRAVAAADEILPTFPLVRLLNIAIWIRDEPATSKVRDIYTKQYRV